ncbi:MAG TPA: energy transducer TonB [Terriglobia bacterium]|nr:energy transducer TonB [Terriglobia bacterium]
MRPGHDSSSHRAGHPDFGHASVSRNSAQAASPEGTVENLQVVSGRPLLIRAAVEAVTQWRYRPTLLNGNPTRVDTTITANFSLSN